MLDPIDVKVGENFRAIRKSKGLSQTEVAKLVKLTFQQIQKYEKASNRISASVLYKLADGMQVSVMDFFRGLDPTDSQPISPTEKIQLEQAFKGIQSENLRTTFLKLAREIGNANI